VFPGTQMFEVGDPFSMALGFRNIGRRGLRICRCGFII
jgi:hypothetical protein